MSKTAILIVEDDAILALHLEDLLLHQEYAVAAIVPNGEEVLFLVQKHNPSLILMDIELKGEMNGIQAAKVLQENLDIPVIFLTSYSQDSLIQQARITAPYGYLVKPVQERELIATIEMALYRHQLDLQLKHSEKRYRSLIEQSSDGIFIIQPNGNFLEGNSTLCEMLCTARSELLQNSLFDFCLPHEMNKDSLNLNLPENGNSFLVECRMRSCDGLEFFSEINLKKLDDSNIQGVVRNINERKREENQKQLLLNRLRTLFEITQYQAKNIQDLLDFSLSSAIRLTGSKIGYIYFYDESSQQFILNSWSKDVMKSCEIAEPQTIYELEKTGLWGEAVRQRKPVMDNDYQNPSSLKKGYPEGHVKLNKFLTIPVIIENQITAVVGVANKTSDYDDNDILQLSLLMDSVWKMVERKRFEEELLESARKFKTLINTSLDGFVLINPQGRFLEVNDTYCQISGYSRDELLKLSINDIDIDESSEETKKRIQKVIANGEDRFEARHRRKDGREIDVEVSTTFLPESNNFLTFFRDITETKVLQKTLKESEEKYRLLVEHSSDLIWNLNPEGSFTYLSPSWKTITGLEPLELIHKPFSSILHPQDLNLYQNYLKKLGHSAKNLSELEVRIKHADNTWHWHALSLTPVPDSARQNISYVGISRDINERKIAEQLLRQKSEELERYFTASLDLLCIADLDGHFLRLNPEWEKTLGVSVEELAGARYLDYVHPEDIEATTKVMVSMEVKKEVLNFINRYRCWDGSYKWIEWRAKVIDNLIYAVARDISAQKEIEAKLLESQVRFERVMDATNDGVYDVDMLNGNRYFSPSYYRMLGYEPGEFEATEEAWTNRIHPEDREYILQLNKDYLNNLIPKLEDEYRMQKKNGEWIWILGRAKAVERDEQGNILRIVGTQMDITERKKIEKARREVEEKFSKIFHLSPDAIAINRLEDGMFMEINDGFVNLSGFTAQEIIGRTILESRIMQKDDYDLVFHELIQKGEVVNKEFLLTIKNQEKVTVLTSARIIQIENEDFILSITRDIREIKQAARKQEEQLNDLLRWQKITLGRETRIMDLKKEVNDLLAQSGLPSRYSSVEKRGDK